MPGCPAGRSPSASCLRSIRLIATPGTLLRWHRDLLSRRWARRPRRKRPGLPHNHRNIKALVIRLAKETHPGRRTHGEKNAGIDPAPQRDTGPTWAEFVRSQAEAIPATDFIVVDLLDGSKAYVLTEWVVQHARHATNRGGSSHRRRTSC